MFLWSFVDGRRPHRARQPHRTSRIRSCRPRCAAKTALYTEMCRTQVDLKHRLQFGDLAWNEEEVMNEGMDRKSIAANVSRKLWAQCGGYCRTRFNRYLFADIGDDSVSLANIAHIIGAGRTGPRSEGELAEFIDKTGFTNLIMLCLECHKIVDELERRFPTDVMRAWKSEHHKRIETTSSFQRSMMKENFWSR